MAHTFSCKYGSFTIQSHGAHLTSWKSAAVGNGEQELLYVSPKAVMDTPGKAIRGGVPICWPQFSDMGPYGMAHGWARSTKWDYLGETTAQSEDSVTAVFSLPKNAAEGLNPEKIDAAFFSNFNVQFEVTLDVRGLSMKLSVQNNNKEESAAEQAKGYLNFTTALHTYFSAGPAGISQVRLVPDTFDASNYADNLQDRKVISDDKGVTVIDKNIDRVYFGTKDKPLSFTYPLSADGSSSSGKRARITVTNPDAVGGFTDAVLWNPWIEKAKAMGDLPDDGYNHFLCIESARVANPVKLAPGQSWSAEAVLSAATVDASTSAAAPSSSLNERARAVLEYWFKSVKAPEPNYELWYGGTPEIDADITAKFGGDLTQAEAGALNGWMDEGPLAALALIIIKDQFALNIYRDKPEGYNCSATAILNSYTAIAKGYDLQINETMRGFFYLPLMHSEKIVDQEKCVELFNNNFSKADASEYAVIHRDIVKKYGRFPGRNKVMDRKSTPEEEEYLKNGGVF